MKVLSIVEVTRAANINAENSQKARFKATGQSSSVESNLAHVSGFKCGVSWALNELIPVLKESHRQIDRLPDYDGLHDQLGNLIASIERGES